MSAPADVAGSAAVAVPLRLHEPLTLTPAIQLRNRLVFQPHYTALGTQDGMPSADHAAYHGARAAGGVGLVIMESQAVHPTGKMNGHFVHAWDPRTSAGYALVAEAVHAHGAAVFAQLTHGGHTTGIKPPPVLWAPTQMSEPSSRYATKAMDRDDIATLINGFVAGARNARAGGIDGIEIKIAHDGLLRTFISPHFNHRGDEYGGSFENRMRLPIEVLRAVREELGDGPALGVRLCLSEFTEWGYDLDYGLRIAEALEAVGVLDYFNCDHGSWSSTWYEIPPESIPEGAFRPLNQGLKKQSDLPVIASGRLRRPALAEEMLAAGEADLIGLARQLIADPDWLRKAETGRDDEIRLCIACNQSCTTQTGQDQQIRCAVNPRAGRERVLLPIPRTPRRKRVVVVGGGPAGMEAALTAAAAGHDVELIERSGSLGGNIRLARQQPNHQQVGDLIDNQATQIERAGVRITLGTSASVESLLAAAPDAIIVASGSVPVISRRADGLDDGSLARSLGRQASLGTDALAGPTVISADDCYTEDAPSSGSAIVIDAVGDWESIGTAELLVQRGLAVTVITAGAVLAAHLDAANRALWHQRMIAAGAALRPNLAPVALAEGGLAVASTLGAGEQVLAADWIVAAVGRRSREDLFLALEQAAPSGIIVRRAGDCVSPRWIEQVVLEGQMTARAVCDELGAAAAVAP